MLPYCLNNTFVYLAILLGAVSALVPQVLFFSLAQKVRACPPGKTIKFLGMAVLFKFLLASLLLAFSFWLHAAYAQTIIISFVVTYLALLLKQIFKLRHV